MSASKNGRREPRPAFQFYAGDFLASDTVACMSNAEIGVYIQLLARAWSGRGLPASVERLARMVGEPTESFSAMWDGPLGECFEERGGRLINARMERERDVSDEHASTQSLRGKFGNAKRYGKVPDGQSFELWVQENAPGDPLLADPRTAIAGCDPSSSLPSHPIPSHPIPVKEQETRARRAPSTRHLTEQTLREIATEFELDPVTVDSAEEWREYRESGLPKPKPISAATLRKVLKQAQADPEKFRASVDHTIANGWLGLRAPDDPESKGRPAGGQFLTPRAANQAHNEAFLDRLVANGLPDAPDSPRVGPGGPVRALTAWELREARGTA